MSVYIVGTLDTKGEEIGFARDVIEAEGIDVRLVDVGVMGEPEIDPDVDAAAVAAAADADLEALREAGDRGRAVEAMGDGAAAVVTRAHEEGTLDGVLGLGGSGNTSMATAAGTATTARSASVSLTSSTQSSPHTVSEFGLTGTTSPRKSARRFSTSARPTDPGRSVAPITATRSGVNSEESLPIERGYYGTPHKRGG